MSDRVQKILRGVNRAARRVFVHFAPTKPECKHLRIEWSDSRGKPFRVHNQPMEMIAASGLTSFMTYIAHCTECGAPIQWSQRKPRPKDLKTNGYLA